MGTDHCPHKIEFKERGKHGDIWDAIPGDNNGIEYFSPVMMSEGVNKTASAWNDSSRSVPRTTPSAGAVPRKGALVEGSDADMVIVDQKSAVVDDDFYHTMEPRYSTFHGGADRIADPHHRRRRDRRRGWRTPDRSGRTQLPPAGPEGVELE